MWTEARGVTVGVLLLALSLGCSREANEKPAVPDSPAAQPEELLGGRSLPATARPEIHRDFLASEARPRDPSDGGGSASVSPSAPILAGSTGSWTILYRAGERGIAVGGSLVLQVSPFWGWSDPQPTAPDRPGFTEVSTDAEGVTLESGPCGGGCLRMTVSGAALPPGATVAIRYGGTGPGAARADFYAEREEEFFLRIDGDGDGVSAPLTDPPVLDLKAGPARSLHLILPSTARVGEEVFLSLAALDSRYNAATDFVGEIVIEDAGGLVGLPERIVLSSEERGAVRIPARLQEPGLVRVVASVPAWQARFSSNPLLVEPVAAAGPRIFWADLHGHTGFSDGTGTPEDYFRYARDVAALDVAAITDHDHWGLRYLDRSPDLWERIHKAVRDHHAPGSFVALLGYEWTSWIFGHRHVIYFGDEGSIFGSTDPGSDEPEELWKLLRGQPAITVAHHPGGGPIATDWSIPPDPELEPVVEIVSVHGSSECSGCPAGIYSAVPGTSVQDALARGFRLGILGSGDTHDGHPGLGSPENRTVGLAAVLAERLDRASILEALRARRVYATSGARIVLRFSVGDAPMGTVLSVRKPERPRSVYLRVIGTAGIETVSIIRDGQTVHRVDGHGETSLELLIEDPIPARNGSYLYARVEQEDGGLAWSSPVWLEVESNP